MGFRSGRQSRNDSRGSHAQPQRYSKDEGGVWSGVGWGSGPPPRNLRRRRRVCSASGDASRRPRLFARNARRTERDPGRKTPSTADSQRVFAALGLASLVGPARWPLPPLRDPTARCKRSALPLLQAIYIAAESSVARAGRASWQGDSTRGCASRRLASLPASSSVRERGCPTLPPPVVDA